MHDKAWHCIRAQVSWVKIAMSSVILSPIPRENRFEERGIRWRAPLEGWYKLNCDAAVTNFGAKAGTGGVLRDHHGNFVLGFAMDLGAASIAEVELGAILAGLNLVWRRGFTKVVIDSDSLTAVQMIKGGARLSTPTPP